MSRARPRPVFSIWAWLILSPYLVIALGGIDGAATTAQWALGAGVALTVHIVLLGVYLGLGAIERAVAGRPAVRWTIVYAAFVGIAFGRPSLVTALQHASGIDLVSTAFPMRVALNLLVIGIGTLLIYAAFETVNRSLDGRRRLFAVLGKLRAQAERVEARAQRIAEEFQREVRRPVLDSLGALVSRDLPRQELAEELRWAAHAVVRPLSHQVTDARLEEALDIEIDGTPTATSIPTGRRLLQPARIIAPTPWVTTIVGMLLLGPPALNLQEIPLGIYLVIAATGVSFLGGILIRLLPLPSRPWLAIAVLSTAELVVGLAVCFVLQGPLELTPLLVYYIAYGTSGYALASVVVAIILSSVREIAGHQQQAAAALADAEHRAFRARQRLAAESLRTGRMLHTEIQGDLVATSLQLRLGTAGEDALERLIERVDATLADPYAGDDEAPTSAASIREGIQASLDAWSLSLDIDADVEPAALDRLAEHPREAAIAHDALTEGLTNAVRHGRGEHARVAIRLADDVDRGGVEVLVGNPGRIAARAGRGIGLNDLDARARRVALTQEGGEVVLRVLV